MDLIVDFPPRARPLRRVSFDESLSVRLVDDLTIEHKASMWFTQSELVGFQHRMKKLVAAIHLSRDISMASFAEANVENTGAFMGLENYMPDSMPRSIAIRRKAVARAVLSEQERQLRAGIYDPDEMARISESLTELGKTRSLVIGLLHADKREELMKKMKITYE